jgi:hypothetical protein
MKLTSLIEGIGLGAVAMFLLDPDRGARRRALLRDQVVHETHKKREAVQIMGRDFVNRSKGLRHRVRSKMDGKQVPDELLVERARAEIGHVVSHSGAVQITCENGLMALSGPILASELEACLRHMQMIPGVYQVLNNLDIHASSEHISALQGGIPRPLTARWTPATCLVMGLTGAFCLAYGRSRKGIVGSAMKVGGMGLITKAFRDTEQRFEPSTRHRFETRSQKALPAMQDSEQVTDRGQAGMV